MFLSFSVLLQSNIWLRTGHRRTAVARLQRIVKDLPAVPLSDLNAQDHSEDFCEKEGGGV